MPYIVPERQAEIDPHLKEFFEKISGVNDSGELNYIITQICIGVTEAGYRYEDLNRIMGVLECAKAEFYRRIIAPYEETKKMTNGDVYPEPE